MHVVETKILFQGWTKLVAVTLELPSGDTIERVVLEYGSAVCVLPFDPERRLALLVSPSRAPLLYLGHPKRLLDAIAGRIEDEAPNAAICREAMEEASLRLEELRHVATCWLSPGVSTVYSSADLVNGGAFHPDEFEDISVQEISLSKLAQPAVNEDADLQDHLRKAIYELGLSE